MDIDVKSCISQSLEELLDKMAFLSFEEVGAGIVEGSLSYAEMTMPDLPRGSIITELEFDGSIKGVVNIGLAPLAADHITRNFLGLGDDEILDKEIMQDGVREFTNILMGRALILMNPKRPHKMDLPHIVNRLQTPDKMDVMFRIQGELDEDPCVVQMVYSPNA